MADHIHHLEQILQLAPAIHQTHPPTGGGGHQGKFGLTLAGGVVVLAKPADSPVNVEMARCEVAAWRVSCLLGWMDLMPATALRDVGPVPNNVFASVQIVWPLAKLKELGVFDRATLWRAALFDKLIDHGDRHASNWIGVEDAKGTWHLKLIDNGLAFGTAGTSLTSEIVEYVRSFNEDIPTAFRAVISNFLTRLPDDYLSSLLPAATLELLCERAVDLGVGGAL